MKNPAGGSLFSFIMLFCGAAVYSASAQTWDFKGYVDASSSAVFNVGDAFNFSVTLAFGTPENPNSYLFGQYSFQLSSYDLTIGSTSYAQSSPLFDVTTWYGPQNQPVPQQVYGINEGWGGYFQHPLWFLNLDFMSSHPITDSNGLLVEGGSISDMTADVTLQDSTFNGFADVVLTSYTVKNPSTITPVPEPSTYGLIGAGILGFLSMARCRKRSA